MSPIALLSDPAHVKQINGVVASLPERIYGYTGLYDTILAAVKRVKEDYDPTKVNSVLFITDGFTEDDDGISLKTLLKSVFRLMPSSSSVKPSVMKRTELTFVGS